MENILEKIIKDRKVEELNKLNAVKIASGLLNELLERERDILTRRFGLSGAEGETLEQIGKLHKLTRERVRQIESSSLKKIKKLDYLDESLSTIKKAVSQLLEEHGGVMDQNLMLDILSIICLEPKASETDREICKKHFDFVISKLLTDDFELNGQSDNFNSLYKFKDHNLKPINEVADDLLKNVAKADGLMSFEDLLELIKNLGSYAKHREKLGTDKSSDLLDVFKHELFNESAELINNNKHLYSLITGVKHINRNKFGDWGLSDSPEVKPKKISDKIYLVLKHQGEPMHFKDIADKINEIDFDHKKANAGTAHNELILDDRFELVGRGLYGLKEWNKK